MKKRVWTLNEQISHTASSISFAFLTSSSACSLKFCISSRAPSYLLYALVSARPSDIGLPKLNYSLRPAFKHLTDIIEAQNAVAKKAADELHIAQEKIKVRHDLNSRHHSIYPGMVCYVKNPFLLKKGTSKKLRPVYSGPFIITSLPSPNTVKICHMDSTIELEKSVHVERIKLAERSAKNPFSERLVNSARDATRRSQEQFLNENADVLISKPPHTKPRKKIVSSKISSLKCGILFP